MLEPGGCRMSSFSIDMNDPREAWEALFREIEASAQAAPETGARIAASTPERAPMLPAEDLVGWLWLMHGCWADDAS